MNKTKSTETDMVSYTEMFALLTLLVEFATLIVIIMRKK